jgi:hypothetical protein
MPWWTHIHGISFPNFCNFNFLFSWSNNYFFDAQILLVNVAMLSLYHSPVNCSSKEQRATFRIKRFTVATIISRPGTYIATWQSWRPCLLKNKEMFEFSELSTSRKFILDSMAGNVVISEVDAPIYVVLRKAEKPRALRRISCLKLNVWCYSRYVALTKSLQLNAILYEHLRSKCAQKPKYVFI